MTTSVYVHFPWCANKCPYCDFASLKIGAERVPHEAYADAILRELESRAAGLLGRRLRSIFFGGGTPSMWAGPALARVVAGIVGAFDSSTGELEVTAECNPASFDARVAESFREAGVNRVSLGVQSLDDRRLRFLGRLHDAAGALRAVEAARACFERVSADLMFGMPDQGPDELRTEIDRLLDTGVRHVSAYALTIEPETPFGNLSREGKLRVADEDAYAAMFEEAESRFAARGFAHYEVSNYAVPGEEAQHNLHYWRGGTYLGLGAAAVGCLDAGPGRARRYRNQPDPARYLEVAGTGAQEESEERLGPEDIVREALMLGLRTAEGWNLDASTARAGVDPLRGRERALATHLERGNLVREGQTLRVPRARWLHLDSIVSDLF